MIFSHAIVRKPGPNFLEGMTTAGLGAPDYPKALEQHKEYCKALKRCGLELVVLEPDLDHPDSTFVEDTAILTPRLAILTHPGHKTRTGEVAAIKKTLEPFYDHFQYITPPGTLDGGDICQAGSHFFIGISERTNPEGANQLAGFLQKEGYTTRFVDIRNIPGVLHLKSGLAYLGGGNMVIIQSLKNLPEFNGYNLILAGDEEDYAANCVRVNGFVLVAQGYPRFKEILENLGYKIIPLDLSEYRKMDGGLSCLSLRF